jgi:HEAT repeat protein
MERGFDEMNVSIDLVRQVLAPEEPDYEGAKSLGKAAVPHLIELMKGPDIEFATKATSLLGMIGGQVAAEALHGAVRDERLTVRIAVAATARNLDSQSADGLMLELLNSPEPVIRKVVLSSMPAGRSSRLEEAVKAIAVGDEVPELRALAARVTQR